MRECLTVYTHNKGKVYYALFFMSVAPYTIAPQKIGSLVRACASDTYPAGSEALVSAFVVTPHSTDPGRPVVLTTKVSRPTIRDRHCGGLTVVLVPDHVLNWLLRTVASVPARR